MITSGETRASAVGTRIVLPGTYPGGDRDMKKRHMDAMAIVHTYGKPDVFLTMTCNPKWEEITNELLPGQTAQDRPDIVARVFYGKLEAMKDMLFKKQILGVVVAYVYVVEFQKRGLPHAHFLLIMESAYKLIVPEQYDRLISAELPDKHKYPELYAMVVKHIMHGPCGSLNQRMFACKKTDASADTRGRSMKTQHRGRTRIQFIDVETTVDVLRSEGRCWTTDGLCLITHTFCGCSIATSMLRSALA